MTPTETVNDNERAFAFLRLNERPHKPRSRGVTEIRGPYYTPVGRRYLEDLFETMAAHIDTLNTPAAPSRSCRARRCAR